VRALALLLLIPSLPAAAAERPGLIEIWTRGPGEEGQKRPVVVDLARTKLEEGELADPQLDGARRQYRYVPLARLIDRYAPDRTTDVALLHFSNGMQIPLPFRDAAAVARLAPVVAVAVRLEGKWTTDLPPILRGNETYFDARPIRFDGNKLVVKDRWHPDLAPGIDAHFSPWLHSDTLVGIELVDGAAFLAQFDVDPAAREGFGHFRRVCRFCHGARRVGAQFGWDFVEPLPIAEYRKKDVSLYYHLRYRATNAPTRGLMMPGLPFVEETDATAMLAWLRALAARPLRPYAPTRRPHGQ
jgi:hypothetical protein